MIFVLKQSALHKQVLLLALPMVVSNITVPLLGLVDAAVIGHLEHAWYLGGVALGSTLITILYWLLGFLRMATTGITAQAWGAKDKFGLALVFVQGIVLSLLLSLLLFLCHPIISRIALQWSDASLQVQYYAAQYASIRIWSAPATLINLVIMGWLLGTQNAKKPMILIILINVTNIVLDLLFVVVFDWQVQGAAYASVCADYLGLMFGFYYVHQIWRSQNLPKPLTVLLAARSQFHRLLKLNRDIFLRSLCLQITFSFMTFQGASFGDDVIAANALLMNFLMLISFAMDGFAYAMEAMVGKAIGAKNREALVDSLAVTTFWSLLISIGITMIFAIFGPAIIDLMSNIELVRQQAYAYLPWLIALPLIAMWCFLLDGIFVGATLAKDMRNTMFIALMGFFCFWFYFQNDGNHALWGAMLTFMALRGGSLGAVFIYKWRKNIFLN